METTNHWNSRNDRLAFIQKEIGIGKPVKTFKWDKGHPNGPELHTITDTGIIIIRNALTNKLVTTLIARPGQIKRYYDKLKTEVPEFIMKLAYEHEQKGYNYI